MPIKKILLTVFILAGFWWMNTATSKSEFIPCEWPILKYLNKDTTNYIYIYRYSHDTVVLKANKDTLLDIKSAAICSILKDSCKINGYKVLIVDTSYDQTTWNTPFGKRLFFRQCP